MKVFDLACVAGHAFEGWFASAEDYQSQSARKLLTCPVCDSAEIRRTPSAPRLNLRSGGHAAGPETGGGAGSDEPSRRQSRGARQMLRHAAARAQAAARDRPDPEAGGAGSAGRSDEDSRSAAAEALAAIDPERLRAAVERFARDVVENTEDVGSRFAEEARRIHYRESPERAIRGEATAAQAEELREEGIDVMPLPWPLVPKKALQ